MRYENASCPRLDPVINVIVFENIRLRPSTRKRETGVFKKIHSGERFRLPKTSAKLQTYGFRHMKTYKLASGRIFVTLQYFEGLL